MQHREYGCDVMPARVSSGDETASAFPCVTLQDSLRVGARLLVTLVYPVALLSLSAGSLSHIIWFAFYPIIGCGVLGVSYSDLLKRSLCVLPFIALIGIANPFFNREAAFEVGGIVITRGWLEFISILLRGLFSVQALLLVCSANGFAGICRAMSRLGLPSVLTTQMLLLYRYIGVLLAEALDMKRARQSRGYGGKALPMAIRNML